MRKKWVYLMMFVMVAILVYAAVPTLVSQSISPVSPSNADNLFGTCEVSEVGFGQITIEYEWYNNSILYLQANETKYNFTSEDLNSKFVGEMTSANQILSSVEYEDGFYLFGNDEFGFYNVTSGQMYDLSTTDAANWMGGFSAKAASLDTETNDVYFSMSSGRYGYYDLSTNSTVELTGKDTADWIGVSILYSGTYESSSDLYFLGGQNGKFGYYDDGSDVTTDLQSADTGNWIGTNRVDKLTADSSRSLVYMLISDDDEIGEYNITSGVATNISSFFPEYQITYIEFIPEIDRLLFGGANYFGLYDENDDSIDIFNHSYTTSLYDAEYVIEENATYLGYVENNLLRYDFVANESTEMEGTYDLSFIGADDITVVRYSNVDGAVYFAGFSNMFGKIQQTENTNGTNFTSISNTLTTIGDNWTLGCRVYNESSYSSWTNTSVTIQNSLPTVTSINITPSESINYTTNLSLSVETNDDDGDSVSTTYISWYENGTERTDLENETFINSNNHSVLSTWIVSVNPFDGTDYGGWFNSSSITIVDNIAPERISFGLSSTSGTNDAPFSIYWNATDVSQINSSIVQVQDPNTVLTNFSMNHSATNGRYEYEYTPSTDGTYSFTVYTLDEYNNLLTSIEATTYSESTETGGGGGGSSGGGGTTTIVTTAPKEVCDITVSPSEVFMSKGGLEEIVISNNESFTYDPIISFTEVDGETDYSSDLTISNPVDTVLPNSEESFGIVYNGDATEDGKNLLVLSSTNCEDIEIELFVNQLEIEQEFEAFFTIEGTLLDTLSGQAIEPVLESWRDDVLVWHLYLAMLAIMFVALFDTIKREYLADKKAKVVLIIFGAIVLSYVFTVAWTIVLRTTLG